MTDVFISYKKEDAARVEPIARALARAGYEVWWDHHIPAGRSYREVIGQTLATAKCVIVVWSSLSVSGQWVLDEADAGKQRNVLLPLMIDDVDIPFGFRQIEAARLVGWSGAEADPEWRNALSAVAHFVGRPPGGPPKPFATPPAKSPGVSTVAATLPAEKSGGGAGAIMGAIALIAVLAVLAGGGYFAWRSGMFGAAPATQGAELTAPDSAVPVDGAAQTSPALVPAEIETHEGDMNAPAPPMAPQKTSPTAGLRRAAFQGGGAIVREASGTWVEENAKTGVHDGYRWREDNRDGDTITLRDDGRSAGMRIELSENAIYLYFPDWGEWKKQWVIADKNYDRE